MRDIPLNPVGDDAYLAPSPAAFPRDTTATDPAFSGDDQSYEFPSLGGDFGPARVQVLSGPADGGEAGLSVTPTLRPIPPGVPTPPIVRPGLAWNNASRLNLFPWFKTPPEGLDMNNPNPPPAPEPPPPPPPTGVTVTGNVLSGNQGTASFSGPASRNATVTLDYSIDGGPMQQVTIAILIGDTGSQIAAKARAAIDAVFGLDASGTGGTLNVVGLGGLLTAFHITVS
jgi:hypothetical protein